MEETKPAIVLTDPKPIPKSTACPQCGAGKDRRRASAGFGLPHPVCGKCGYEWHDEEWR